MKYILILILIIPLFASCATNPETTPEIAPPQIELPDITEFEALEDPVEQEYDKIIKMCRGMFESYGSGVTRTCILVNFYAMNNADRMYIDDVVTDTEFNKCHKPEFYFPEYETYWYKDVWKCLMGETENFDTETIE